MKEDTLYQLALTRTPGIGDANTKKLLLHFGSAKAIFHAKKDALSHAKVNGKSIDSILNFRDWEPLEKELTVLERKGIRILTPEDDDYPRRLSALSDAPPFLFYKGNADLNTQKIIAIIGTRAPSDYGKQITQKLVQQLAQPGLLIISGLAYGIDACAHKAALKYHTPTLGILGHGLGHLYPSENIPLAKDMVKAGGGLLARYPYSTGPEPYYFIQRNHIVAGLCDALIVVETGRMGGSLSTVKKAQEYGRKVFAVPGRLIDPRSAGCNMLIQQGRAEMLFDGQQFRAAMGWEWPAGKSAVQPQLPFLTNSEYSSTITGDGQLTTLTNSGNPVLPGEGQLLKLLTEGQSLSFDELAIKSQQGISTLSLNLLSLEFQGLISPLPGRRYRLC